VSLALAAAWRIARDEPLPAFGRALSTRPARAAVLGALALACAIVAWGAVRLTYDTSPTHAALREDFTRALASDRAAPIAALVRAHVLPETYAAGLAHVAWASEERPSYLAGRWSLRGFRS